MRRMTEADLPAISILEQRCFSDPWPLTAFREVLEGDQWTGLVAEAEGVIVGYSCHFDAAGEAHLANIAVHPEHRRKSVAKQILKRILDLSRNNGCYQILLEVRPSNVSAIRFYENEGFVVLYRRPNYYRSPVEEAVVMCRQLDDGTDDE